MTVYYLITTLPVERDGKRDSLSLQLDQKAYELLKKELNSNKPKPMFTVGGFSVLREHIFGLRQVDVPDPEPEVTEEPEAEEVEEKPAKEKKE